MDRSTEKLIRELRKYSTPELCDGAIEYHTMDYHITEQITDKKIVGRAYTVKPPKGVSGIVPDAILAMEPGQILVIAGEGYGQGSYWGNHRSICAKMKGAEGIIIDGALRDLEGCREAGVPLFATNVTCGSCKKDREGELNVPVICGGVEVCPGDYIVADCNGIIVMKEEEIPGILERAQAKIEAEQYTIRKMKETGEIIPRVIRR